MPQQQSTRCQLESTAPESIDSNCKTHETLACLSKTISTRATRKKYVEFMIVTWQSYRYVLFRSLPLPPRRSLKKICGNDLETNLCAVDTSVRQKSGRTQHYSGPRVAKCSTQNVSKFQIRDHRGDCIERIYSFLEHHVD
jgi:hypothetical protein